MVSNHEFVNKFALISNFAYHLKNFYSNISSLENGNQMSEKFDNATLEQKIREKAETLAFCNRCNFLDVAVTYFNHLR